MGLKQQLITQNSNLRLLKFGKDLPGAGTSRQPYVTKPLPGVEDPLSPNSPDYLLRQGTLRRIVDDETRFFKYFTSTQGLAFIGKQNLLSLTSVRTQASKGPSNQGVYLPTSTAAQLAANPFGGHLNFLGADPTGLIPGISITKYEDLVKPSIDLGLNSSGLLGRISNVVSDTVATIGGALGIDIGGDIVNNNRLVNLFESKSGVPSFDPRPGISPLPNVLLSYRGGPGAGNQGVGRTNIKRYVNTLELTNKGLLKGTPKTDSSINTFVNTQIELQNQVPFRGNGIGFIREDFRKALRDNVNLVDVKKVLPSSPNYSGTDNKNWETRTNYSTSPGNPEGKVDPITGEISYVRGRGTALDQINALPIYQSNLPDKGQDEVGEQSTNDLIKFRIGVVDNDDPEKVNYIHFRAFIDSFSDSYTGDWSSERYPGRGEQFYRYNGFTRGISLSFTTAAQSKQELIPMYKKLNYLASATMNDYSPSGYMRAPFIKLTVGGYLFEQFGFIKSLNYDWEMGAPFEIGINDGNPSFDDDNDVKELPHVIRVTGFQFQPIYQFLPQKQSLTFGDDGEVFEGPEHYIALNSGDDINWNGTTISA